MPPLIFKEKQTEFENYTDGVKPSWKEISGSILNHYAPKTPFYVYNNVTAKDEKNFYKSNVLQNARSN